MKLRLFGVKIVISLPFTVMLSAMILLDKTGLLSAAFLAALVHEAWHIIAMYICGVKPSAVYFYVGAVEIVRSCKLVSKFKEVMISLSGPMINIIIGLLLLSLYGVLHNTVLINYGIVQLTMGAFNLLPVRGLDGGTVIETLTGNRSITVLTSAVIIVAFIAWKCIMHPDDFNGMGIIASIVHIAAMQLMCAHVD